ncbi:MAG: hemolysin family protein [Spirochaetaceae bacterium]|jgi:CBS domain containing-hemolysin-like protein|nr:hemolysin family protein [Spirochaetaceae bacterium]
MSERNFFTIFFKNLFGKKDDPIKDYGSLESEKQDMIRGVIAFGETTVKEIMVPRIDTLFLQSDMPKDDILKMIAESEHSRFPVYKDTTDNVIGIVYVKDILKKLVTKNDFEIEEVLHKPFFVPESKHIDELFHEFQAKHVHIAIVVDEYGGMSGIVSMEDILEEIVGDIQDEFDNEKEDIIKLNENVWLCDARVNLEDLSESINIALPFAEFDTLGGFVFDLFGKIPVKNEKVFYNNLIFIVHDMDGRKINSIKLIVQKETEQ